MFHIGRKCTYMIIKIFIKLEVNTFNCHCCVLLQNKLHNIRTANYYFNLYFSLLCATKLSSLKRYKIVENIMFFYFL